MSLPDPSAPKGDDLPLQFMNSITAREFTSLTSGQKGFIVSIRSLHPDLQGEQLREIIAELFPPVNLFAQKICDLPSVWVELRNSLNAGGANIPQHSSRRIILTLAHGLYPEADYRDAAVKISNLIVAAGRKVRPNLQRQEPTVIETRDSLGNEGQGGNDGGTLAHNVAMRLKDSDKKFSDLGECWMYFVDEYSQIARDYGLSPMQKLLRTGVDSCLASPWVVRSEPAP